MRPNPIGTSLVASSLLGLSALVVAPAAWATPVALSHQGYLLGANDAPVDRAGVAFGVSLWSSASGGTQIWPASGESACVADVAAGYFALLLDGSSSGCGAGLSAEVLATGSEHWFAVRVDGVLMAPRVRIVRAPVATQALALAGILPVAQGGTGATDAAGARAAIGAAQAGANADITSLTGLSTAITVAQGGTGATDATGARAAIGAAKAGANEDITSLTGLSTAISVAQGGTGATDATGARAAIGAAKAGANADITSITGLTTALSVAQGGTGASSLTANRLVVGAGTSALTTVAPTSQGQVLTLDASLAPVWAAPSGTSQWATNGSHISYQGGSVGIGTTTPAARLHVEDNAITAVRIQAAGTGFYPELSQQSARGTLASPGATQLNDVLGRLTFGGHTGSTFTNNRATITASAAENFGTSAHGTQLTFATTPLGGNTPVERLRINANGEVSLGGDLTVGGTIKQAIPAFRGQVNGIGEVNATNNVDVPFEFEAFDTLNNYTPSTGAFVAPIAGIYWFSTNVAYNSGTSATSGRRSICFAVTPSGGSATTNMYADHMIVNGAADPWNQMDLVGLIKLNVGDKVTVRFLSVRSGDHYWNGGTGSPVGMFMGHLVTRL